MSTLDAAVGLHDSLAKHHQVQQTMQELTSTSIPSRMRGLEQCVKVEMRD